MLTLNKGMKTSNEYKFAFLYIYQQNYFIDGGEILENDVKILTFWQKILLELVINGFTVYAIC